MPLWLKIISRVLLTGLLASASAVALADEIMDSVSPGIVSRSIFRGAERGGAALQTAVDIYGDDVDLRGGLWASFPLEGSGPTSPGTEIDLYAARTVGVATSLTLTTGATLYVYPRADRSQGFRRATFEPSLALNTTIVGAGVTPKLSYDLSLKATTLEVTTIYALALPSLGTELDWSLTGGSYLRRDDAAGFAANTRAWGNYWQAGVTLPYQVGPHTRLLVGWAYAAGSGAAMKVGGGPRRADPRMASRGFVSLGFSSTF
jgi:hypothetical protein